MIFFTCFSLVFIFTSVFSPVFAEDSLPYLIPQTVFVGDRAVLIVPLGGADRNFKPRTIEPPKNTDALVFHRIALERKGDLALLTVDFTAYKTGTLELPDIESFSGLTVTVSSLLTPSSLTLSPPARPIPVPGTTALIYIIATAVILCLLLGIGARIFGAARFAGLRRALIRRYLVLKMERFIAKMRKTPENGRASLDLLSAEFRRFLTRFTGVDCIAMSAGEFAALPARIDGGLVLTEEHGISLKNIFRRWDALRFNAENTDALDFAGVLNEARAFIGEIASAAGGKNEF